MFENTVDKALEKLSGLVNTKSAFGEAFQIGDVTLIPVADITFGFGGGGGEGQDQNKQGGTGGGGGGGGRVKAKAVIAIKGGEISVLPVGKGGAIDAIMEAVPGIIEKFTAKKADEPKAE